MSRGGEDFIFWESMLKLGQFEKDECKQRPSITT